MIIDKNSEASSFTSRGSRVPTPPKPGEIMICQMCGQPLLPEHFSKNLIMRRREFKWHIHPWCFEEMNSIADRGVPGLMAERNKANR